MTYDEESIQLNSDEVAKITTQSRVPIQFPSGEEFVVKPVTTSDYFNYLEISENKGEMEAKTFIIKSALVTPVLTHSELLDLPPGQYFMLYKYIRSISFLQQKDLKK